jgi:hypothetical protein
MDIVPSSWDVVSYWYGYDASLADVEAYWYGFDT